MFRKFSQRICFDGFCAISVDNDLFDKATVSKICPILDNYGWEKLAKKLGYKKNDIEQCKKYWSPSLMVFKRAQVSRFFNFSAQYKLRDLSRFFNISYYCLLLFYFIVFNKPFLM